jgi:dTDP-4-amino-4,6-dideoxygalactose transaminase
LKIPLIDLRAQYVELRTEIKEAINRVLESGTYIGGPEVEGLESSIADLLQTRYAVAVASGTDALTLSLEAAGIGAGDEVITTAFTFFATAEAIAKVGATPVFADIEPDSYNLCPKAVEAAITPKTKGIIPVHIFGQPANMDRISELAKAYSLTVIEDACQAIGAEYKGRPVGGIGNLGCLSFFPTKNLGGYGDGGIVVTNNGELAERVRLLAHHGSKIKYFHETLGGNSRLDPIQAAVISVKLGKLAEWNQRRANAAAFYDEALRETPLLAPAVTPGVSHVYHLYATQCRHREVMMERLKEHGISTGHYYPCPLHLQKALAYLGYKQGDLPVTEQVAHYSLALPISPQLTTEQQQYIIEKVHECSKGLEP